MEKVELLVINVHCRMCSAKLEKMLSELDGVESASINIPEKLLTMQYDPEIVSVDEVRERFVEMGYDIEM